MKQPCLPAVMFIGYWMPAGKSSSQTFWSQDLLFMWVAHINVIFKIKVIKYSLKTCVNVKNIFMKNVNFPKCQKMEWETWHCILFSADIFTVRFKEDRWDLICFHIQSVAISHIMSPLVNAPIHS